MVPSQLDHRYDSVRTRVNLFYESVNHLEVYLDKVREEHTGRYHISRLNGALNQRTVAYTVVHQSCSLLAPRIKIRALFCLQSGQYFPENNAPVDGMFQIDNILKGFIQSIHLTKINT